MNQSERFVEFRSGKNMLRGMAHVPGGRGKAPAVLMLHGFTGTRIESHFIFVKTARALAEAGIAALRFDFAGSGESEGFFEEMSVLTELSDARTALDFLERRRGVDRGRLGVLGLSMGGCVAGMLLEDERLRAGILWAAVAQPSLLAKVSAPPGAQEEMARRGFVSWGAHKIGRRFVEDIEGADPLAGVARSRADILIVHGTGDEAVPPDHARMFEKVARGRSGPRTELVLIEGAHHTFDLVPHEEEAIRRTVEWFGQAL